MATSKDFQFLLNFLVDVKADPSKVESAAKQIQSVLNSIELNPNIDFSSPEVIEQLNNISTALSDLENQSGTVGDALSGIQIGTDFNDAFNQVTDLANFIETELNGVFGDTDLSPLADALNQLSSNEVAALGEAMSSALSDLDTSAIGDAVNTAASQLDSLAQKAAKTAAEQQALLNKMAGQGKQGSAEYKALQDELTKVQAFLQKLQSAANVPIKPNVTQPTVTPKIDAVPPAQATKVGTDAAEKIKDGFKKVDLEGTFKTVFAVFGGNVLTKGIDSVVGSFSALLEAGKKSTQAGMDLKLAFQTAGESGAGLQNELDRTGKFAKQLSNDFAVSVGSVREFARQAAFIGGATGEANEKVATLATVIEKASKGMVDGSMVVRAFTKGLGDPEAEANIGRLKMQFPALATALKDIKDPAEMADKALQALSPTMNALKEQAASPLGAMERLENQFAAIKTQLGKSLFELFAPLVTAVGDVLIPAIQSANSAISGTIGFIKENADTFKIVGISVGVLAASVFLLSGSFTTLLASIGASAAALWGKVTAMAADIAATVTATIMQWNWNAAMAANPVGAVLAAVVALAAGIYLLVDAMSESIEEQIEDAKAKEENIVKTEQLNQKQQEALKSKQALAEQFRNEGEAAMNNADLLKQLAKAYPGVIDMNKSYTENLEALNKAAGKNKEELGKLKDDMLNIQVMKFEAKKMRVDLEVRQGGEELKEDIEDEVRKMSGDRIALLANLKAMENALTGEEAEKIGIQMMGTIFATEMDETKKAEMADKVQKQMDKVKERIDHESKQIPSIFEAMVKDGEDEEAIIDKLSKMFGKTPEQIKAIIGQHKEQIKKTEEAKQTVGGLAEEYNKLKDAASKALSESLAGMARLIAKQREQGGKLNEQQQIEFDNARKTAEQAVIDGKQFEKDLEAAKKMAGIKDTSNKIAVAAFEKMKKEIDVKNKLLESENQLTTAVYERRLAEEGRQKGLQDELILQAKNLDLLKQQKDNTVQMKVAIKTKQEQAEYDELINNINLKILQSETKLKEMQVKVNIDRAALREQLLDLEQQRIEYEISIGIRPEFDTKEIVNVYQQRAALIEEQIKENAEKLAKSTAKFSVSITKVMDEDEYNALMTAYDIEKMAYDKAFAELEKKQMDNNKAIFDINKKAKDDRLKLIQDEQSAKEKSLADQFAIETENLNKLNELWTAGRTKSINKELAESRKNFESEQASEIARIEELAELEIYTKEQAEKKKKAVEDRYRAEQLEAERIHANKLNVLRQEAVAAEMALKISQIQRSEQLAAEKAQKELDAVGSLFGLTKENQEELASLQQELSKASLDLEANTADEAAKIRKENAEEAYKYRLQSLGLDSKQQKEIDSKLSALNNANLAIENEASKIAILKEQFGGIATEAITGMFAGDGEAMAEGLRKTLATLVGYLEAKLKAFVLDQLLSPSVIAWLDALPFPLNLAAYPIAKGLIEGAVGAIAAPLFSEIAKFGSGGLATEQQIALVGDAPPAAYNPEWILSEPQLQSVIQTALGYNQNALLNEIKQMNMLLSGLQLKTSIELGRLNVGLQQAKMVSNQRTR